MSGKNLAYRTIGVARAAISAFHANIGGRPVGAHPWVTLLHKGVSNQNPPKPKYCFIWDVETVLKVLRTDYKDENQLSLMELTEKTVMLLALASARRGSELKLLDINLMAQTESKLQFWFKAQTKGCRGHRLPKPLEIVASGSDLCPVRTTREYLKRTASTERPSQLFIATVKPHKEVTRATIGRWLQNVLKRAGVDVEAFKSHSTRSASTSAAHRQGISIEDILERGQWSNDSTWQKFYNKEIVSATDRFQMSLFSGNQL